MWLVWKKGTIVSLLQTLSHNIFEIVRHNNVCTQVWVKNWYNGDLFTEQLQREYDIINRKKNSVKFLVTREQIWYFKQTLWMEYYVPSQLTMIRLYFGSTLFSVMLNLLPNCRSAASNRIFRLRRRNGLSLWFTSLERLRFLIDVYPHHSMDPTTMNSNFSVFIPHVIVR